ncbi:MAG TPA: tyrosine-type recombinase/integrase [Mycobacteriales bacterium]|nr:tyrosine-type recombinase/integrase [Mycobacteriales bacterium]
MGHVVPTPAGSYRANWRDAAGRQRSKTFKTKREANAFLAETETALNRGSYVDPHAGRLKFGAYATRWLEARNDEITTAARDASIMRNHVVPRWGATPLAKIDHLAVQQWVTKLGSRLSPATVVECHRLTSAVMRSAVRDRLVGANPCEGVRLPKRRRKDTDDQVISRAELTGCLLPAVPDRYRALVALAGGTGLRWGECAGLRWDAVDLVARVVRVVRVAVEVSGRVSDKSYPKSRAGRRTIPLPGFVVELLAEHQRRYPPGPAGLVFTSRSGAAVRRTTFRAKVWRPSLVRAGLLGKVVKAGPYRYLAHWHDDAGCEWSKEFTTERDAVEHVVRHAHGGLRFHDLRHSYATWLVSAGVPINDVSAVMGHEQTSTTLDRYTHPSQDRDRRVRSVFADFSLTPDTQPTSETDQEPDDEGS